MAAFNPETGDAVKGLLSREANDADSSTPISPFLQETETPKRAKPKRSKPTTKLKRTKQLHERVVSVVDELKSAGFGEFLPLPGPVALIGSAVDDPKTGGKIGHVQEPLGVYIQRVSVQDNFFQRSPFDHVTDPIYRRLIRDFLDGAAMPESKIAALDHSGGKVSELGAEMRYSVIDGLQRLYCYLIALLMTWRREQLAEEGYIPQPAWEFFAESVNRSGDARQATEALLCRTIRFEIFYGINITGLLHYMVTFNTSQRRMSLRVQLEIMKKPLVEHLKRDAITIWEDLGRMPGEQKPREAFLASDLVLATQAFITNNSQVTAGYESERFLDENQPYLDNLGDISDVTTTLRRITSELHGKIQQVYQNHPSRCYLLSSGGTFLLGFIAACGYVRNRGNMMILNRALDKALRELDRAVPDPLNLEAYETALELLSTGRGKAARRLVDDTFRRFFLGVTTELEWLDTARQISESAA
jgi:hypothetical protein